MLNYILYKIGQFIALHLPLKAGYRLAIFFSDLHYLTARRERQAVRENLKAIFPEKCEAEIRKIRIAVFRNFAKYLVDFFRFESLDQEYINENIRLVNINYLDEGLSRGKGLITLTAHLGNWELGGVVIALLGYPFWAVALPHKHKKIDDFFNAQRERKGVKVMPLGRAAHSCITLLKDNNIVALVGDRDFSSSGIVADFFGRETHFPAGPAYFALKTGAVIVPGFMYRNPDDTFTLKFEKPIEPVSSGNRDKDIQKMVASYKEIIGDYVRRFPDQWYMFMRYWKT